MKNMTLLFTFSLAFQLHGISQDNIIPVDEYGRYTYYDVVEATGFDSIRLLSNAESFLKYYVNKKRRNSIKKEAGLGKITGRSSFFVFKKGSLGKNVDGSIEYSITIEVKGQKYRYTLTDFYFQEYERNRYGKFVPVKGKIIPLEQPSSKINEWQWDAHRSSVNDKMEELIEELKLDMLRVSNDEKVKKAKKDW